MKPIDHLVGKAKTKVKKISTADCNIIVIQQFHADKPNRFLRIASYHQGLTPSSEVPLSPCKPSSLQRVCIWTDIIHQITKTTPVHSAEGDWQDAMPTAAWLTFSVLLCRYASSPPSTPPFLSALSRPCTASLQHPSNSMTLCFGGSWEGVAMLGAHETYFSRANFVVRFKRSSVQRGVTRDIRFFG